MAGGLQLTLSIPPQWARIDRVRQAVGLCLAAVFADTELEDALAMTCAELLENAIKYGEAQSSGIDVVMFDREGDVIISVSNSVSGALSTHAARLHARIAWISGFSSACDAYMAALAEVSERPPQDARESGLGLVRIAYEGGCTLQCATEGNRLTVSAHHKLSAKHAAA